MRDALSLLDQLIAFGGGTAGEAEARAMLGTIARDHVVRIAELLAAADSTALLRCAQSLEEFAPDYAQVLDELAALLVRVATQAGRADYEGDELYAPELLERLARALTREDVQLYYQTAIIGRRDLPLAPDPRSGFEMTLLRMLAFRPAGATLAAPTAPGEPQRAAPRAGAAAAPAAALAPQAAAAAAGAGRDGPWAQIVSQLELAGARASSRTTAPSSAARARWCAWRWIRATSWCAPPRRRRSSRRRCHATSGKPCAWSSRR